MAAPQVIRESVRWRFRVYLFPAESTEFPMQAGTKRSTTLAVLALVLLAAAVAYAAGASPVTLVALLVIAALDLLFWLWLYYTAGGAK